MPVTIRAAVLDDVPALLAIERGTASAAHWTQEQYGHRVADGLILVSEEAGSVSGFVCARGVAREWEIENIVVAEWARRRGVGGGLLDELLRSVWDQAGTGIWLEVRESNQPARRLYENRGFRQTGWRRGYYREPVEDAVVYGLHFDPDDGAETQLKA